MLPKAKPDERKKPALVHKMVEWQDDYGVYWTRSLCGLTGPIAESLDDTTCSWCRDEYAKRKGIL